MSITLQKQEPEGLTHDFVLQDLIIADGIPVSFTFTLLATKVFDSFVVQEAISMNPPGDSILIVHSSANLSAPLSHDDTCNY